MTKASRLEKANNLGLSPDRGLGWSETLQFHLLTGWPSLGFKESAKLQKLFTISKRDFTELPLDSNF